MSSRFLGIVRAVNGARAQKEHRHVSSVPGTASIGDGRPELAKTAVHRMLLPKAHPGAAGRVDPNAGMPSSRLRATVDGDLSARAELGARSTAEIGRAARKGG